MSGGYRDPASARLPDPIPGEGDVRALFSGGGTAPSTCSFRAFGTVVGIAVYGEPCACREAFDAAVAACRVYERRLSTRLPHSDIARLNASHGEPCEVHPETVELLDAAKHYCELSEGFFDVTVQPAVRLWDFERGMIPDAGALAEAVGHVDWRGLDTWNEGGRWLARLADPLAEVDLGGIAKGWIADRLVGVLSRNARGLDGFSVNLGGNVAFGGSKPDGRPWSVGVRDPSDPEGVLATVEVASGAVVTSGTYERFFRKDGRLYHHVLDPKTGMPAETDLAGATVVASTALAAEGFSTTLLALGSERAAGFARREPSVLRAIFITEDGLVEVAG